MKSFPFKFFRSGFRRRALKRLAEDIDQTPLYVFRWRVGVEGYYLNSKVKGRLSKIFSRGSFVKLIVLILETRITKKRSIYLIILEITDLVYLSRLNFRFGVCKLREILGLNCFSSWRFFYKLKKHKQMFCKKI